MPSLQTRDTVGAPRGSTLPREDSIERIQTEAQTMHEMADQMQLLDLNLSPVGSKKPWKGRTTREDAHGASHSENRNGFAKANEFLP